VSSQDVADNPSVERALPLLRLRCEGCSYGVSVRRTPQQCPMCAGSVWLLEESRPWAGLTDFNPDANAALTRDTDGGMFPGAA
jgi:hypothetical protein